MICSRVLVSLLSLGLAGCIFYAPVDLGMLSSRGDLEETVVMGDDGPKVLLLDLTGMIADSTRRSSLGLRNPPSPVAEVREILERATDEDDVEALIVRINSPGGTVSASETVYHEIEAWKTEHEKPVIAYINGLAASGGYYAAMAADEVIAHPTAITGSIGVIMPGINVAGLMERFGVTDQTVTSGPFKDTGSPTRPMRPEEREQLQRVISDLYARFTEVVAAGRPKLDRAAIERVADGRIFTARQALELGLVDRIGYLDEAVEAAEQSAGIEESQTVIYHRPNRTKENIYSRLSGPPIQVNLDLWPFRRDALEPGFYYLWPLALQR